MALVHNQVPAPKAGSTVVLAGAGASFGALVPDPPPLMSGFIREGLPRVRSDYTQLWEILDTLGYPLARLEEGRPNLEEVYSILDVVSMGLWTRDETEYKRELGQDFLKYAPVLLLESFIVEVLEPPSSAALREGCSLHDRLIRALTPGDTVISFNYDLILDASIARTREWCEPSGYGFRFCNVLEHWDQGIEVDKDPSSVEGPSEILLLKPHGSLNWQLHEELRASEPLDQGTFHERLRGIEPGLKREIRIRRLRELGERAYEGVVAASHASWMKTAIGMHEDEDVRWAMSRMERPLPRSYIVPPSFAKFGNPRVPEQLVDVWVGVRHALSTAGVILCIGYSFPPNDIEFSTLFRWAVRSNPRADLCVHLVNPDEAGLVRQRLGELIPDVPVEHVAETMKEYVQRFC